MSGARGTSSALAANWSAMTTTSVRPAPTSPLTGSPPLCTSATSTPWRRWGWGWGGGEGGSEG